MDGELLKYLIYFWMLAVAGIGVLSFLVNLVGTARIRVTSDAVARYKRSELLKVFLRLFLLGVILTAALFAAKYLGSMTT